MSKIEILKNQTKLKKRVQIQNTEADQRAGLLPFTPDAWKVVHLPFKTQHSHNCLLEKNPHLQS